MPYYRTLMKDTGTLTDMRHNNKKVLISHAEEAHNNICEENKMVNQ